MSYFPEFDKAVADLREWMSLRKEQGGLVASQEKALLKALRAATRKLEKMPVPPALASREPSDLEEIRALRPRGPRKLKVTLSKEALADRMRGAWLGRAAGCVLGIPCEGMTKSAIRNAAKTLGMKYPLSDYWTIDPKPGVGIDHLHYGVTPRQKFLQRPDR